MKAELIDVKDIAYAAGFIEADGCFHITNSGIGIRVANRNTWVLNWFVMTFGGYINDKATPANCWEWNLYGEEAAQLCAVLIPHLKFKYEEANTLIEFYSTVGARGRNIPQEIKDRRNDLRLHLKNSRKVRSNAS